MTGGAFGILLGNKAGRCPELDTEVEDKKETKRQKQVDLLETDMIRQASPRLSMLETDVTAPCTGQTRHSLILHLLIQKEKYKYKPMWLVW